MNNQVSSLLEQLAAKGERRIELLKPAISKAVEVGLLPKNVPAEDNLKAWDNIESVKSIFRGIRVIGI